MEKNHYVYMYLRETDNTPYYIGKGIGKRAYKKHSTVNIPPNKEKIIIYKSNLTNQEACQLEIELISKYGRKDIGTGILRNQTNGGDGGDTSKSQGYLKYKKSKRFKDNCREISDRMKNNNPMYNEETVKKANTKERKENISKALTGKKKSDEHRKKLSESLFNQKDILKKRTSELWRTNEFMSKVKKGMSEKINKLRQMTEEEFYEWIKDKKLFSYDSRLKVKRPNSRVISIVRHFNKIEEFYGEYYKNKKKK